MYSAQLGRGRLKPYDAEWKVAEALTGSNIDVFLLLLLPLTNLAEECLPDVLRCHDRLVEIVRRGVGQNALSFSSKYLSFHLPRVIPILDSRAEKEGKKILTGDGRLRGYGRFEKHCRRMLALLAVLRESGFDDPDIKIIDHVLYAAAA
jgi:hypothetical protein